MEPIEALKKVFGHDSFRFAQEQLITALMQGSDVVGIMPTGAGKSVCYQVPALCLKGITLVISPLIALMKDQVAALKEAGVAGAYINTSLTPSQISLALRRAAEGRYKIIYVAPERLETAEFRDFAAHADISLIAIDEAHCVSQWGQDFRPSYLKIKDFIASLPKRPPVGAFTATATDNVKQDIISLLGLKAPKLCITGFDRPNLIFDKQSFKGKKEKTAFAIDYVKQRMDKCGIIYCSTRAAVEDLAFDLMDAGVNALPYHAGLDQEVRKHNQEEFIYDRCSVIVATNAFGMGIDKSNVGYVLHFNMPSSLEAYYQEAGRAGRDGETAECMLMYAASDVVTCRHFISRTDPDHHLSEEERRRVMACDSQRLQMMIDYSTTKDCLRNTILRYFGEDPQQPCGNCGNCSGTWIKQDITDRARAIINCILVIRSTQQRFCTQKQLWDELNAKGENCCTPFLPPLRGLRRLDYDELINELLRQKLLVLGDKCLHLGGAAIGVIKNNTPVTAVVRAGRRITRAPVSTEATLSLFAELRALRKEIAEKEHVPAFIVFSDATLRDMALKRPTDKKAFLNVKGIGDYKAEKYADIFTKRIKELIK